MEGSVTLQPGALIALSSDTATDMVGSRYALLSATGGISGSYTVQQDPLADLELRLSSDANSIDGVIVRTGASLARVAQTANQAAVAGPLAALGVDSDAYVALTATITDDVAPAGLSQLAGEVHASLRTVMTQDALGVEDTVRGRMDNLASSRTGLWMQFLGGHGKDDGVRGAADVGHSMIGSMAGVDMALGGNAHIGITGGYTRTTLDVYGLASHARIGATHVLAYAGANSGAFRVRGTIGYAWNHIDTRRSIAIDGFSDQNRARYIGDTLHGFGEIGYAFSYRGGTIEPFVRGMALHLHTGSFEENGGNAALVGSGESVTAKFSDVGVRWAMPLAPTVQLRVSTAWQQAYHIVQSEARLAFAKGGSSFDVIGTGLSRNAVTPRLDIAWQPVEGFRVSAGYAGLYGARNRQSNGRLTLGIAF